MLYPSEPPHLVPWLAVGNHATDGLDVSTNIALADATTDSQHGGTQCLSGRDLIGYDFLSISKEGFVPMYMMLTFKARLGNVVFQ
jgi:hypothetical protein